MSRQNKQKHPFRPQVEALEERWVPTAPTVTGLSLSTGSTGGGTLVTITGADLTGATAVDFGSTVAKVSSNTATSIVATAPPGTETVDVTVTTGGGTSPTSAPDQFTDVGPLVPAPPSLGFITGKVLCGNNVGVSGITITLTGNTTSGTEVNTTTQTDANGQYTFSQLLPGTYDLSRGSTDIYLSGQGTSGVLGGSQGVASISNINLQNGEDAANCNFTIDFISLKGVSLGNYLNTSSGTALASLFSAGSGNNQVVITGNPNPSATYGNGTTTSATISGSVVNQTSGARIAGVELALTGVTISGAVISPLSTTTDSLGNYLFSGINQGTYAIQIVGGAGDFQAVTPAMGTLGGLSSLNTQIFDIMVPSSSVTGSGYNFEMVPDASSGAGSAGPVIMAGLQDDSTAVTSANLVVQGTVTPGSDGAAITQLLAGINLPSGISPTFDITSDLNVGSFFLNQTVLAQIAGTSLVSDTTYTLQLLAIDAQGKSITLPVTFTLNNSTPGTPTMTVTSLPSPLGVVNFDSPNSVGLAPIGGTIVFNMSNPNTAVSSATITLAGQTSAASAGDKAMLYAGTSPGQSPLATTAVGGTGSFSFTSVSLTAGVNNFVVVVQAPNGSFSYATTFVVLNQVPTITSYASGASPDPLALSVASGATSTIVNLADGFNNPNAANTIIQMNTSAGPVYVQLFDSKTPQTVDNFLAYINAGNLNNVLLSRLKPGFVLQGGEDKLGTNPTTITAVTPLPTINGEVSITSNPSTGNHNFAGTLAVPLPSGTTTQYNDNGGSLGFFFNLNNDSTTTNQIGNNLDSDFSIFGSLLSGADQRIINQLASAPTVNESSVKGDLTDLPLNNYNGSDFPTDATASNFELINNATVISQTDQLSYQVTVADPSNVLQGDTAGSTTPVALTSANGTINPNLTLSLNLNANVTGTVTLNVTATNLAGSTVTQTFTVKVA